MRGNRLRVTTMPPFLRERLWWYLAIIGVLVIISSTAWFVPGFIGGPGWVRWVMMAIYFVGLPCAITWFVSGYRHYHRRVRDGGVICWTCGYDLAATASPGTCPECGTVFTAGDLRERWLQGTVDTRHRG